MTSESFRDGVLTRTVLEQLNGSSHRFRVTLDLSWKNIRKISEGAFRDLTDLKELELSNNKLKEIKERAFYGLVNLQILDLRINRISNIAGGAFQNLSNLRILYLTQNKIQTIESDTFRGLDNLEKLALSLNEISEIRAYAFEHLPNLKVLSLNAIKLERIEDQAFHRLAKLEKLYLHDNKIKKITQELFQALFKSISLIDIGNNQFVFKAISFYNGPATDRWSVPSAYTSDSVKFLRQFPSHQTSSRPPRTPQLRGETINQLKLLAQRDERIAKDPNEKIKRLELEKNLLKEQLRAKDESIFKMEQELKAKDPLSRYSLEYPQLGFGGFGIVHKAYDNKTNTFKAIKFIKKADRTALNELNSYVKLDHENILRYFDHFDYEIFDDLHTCIVVQFCENGDLKRQIKNATNLPGKKLEQAKILSWMRQTANGLQYLHSDLIKIVHRDIKPGNLLLTAQDVLKIGDLGLAKSLQYSVVKSVVGTPPYMSPEQYKNTKDYEDFPYQTDVW